MINLTRCRGEEFGGKAESLGRLLRAGFNVQPGIAAPWDEPNHTSIELFNDLVRCVGSMKVTVQSKWAVRSSAIGEDGDEHSFAGQHDTLLNVECWELASAMSKIRASADNERSRIYRRDRGIHTGPKMGIVIQRMVPHVILRAVVFTHDPVTYRDDVVIEYTAGLGDKLVGGEVSPEQVVIIRAKPSVPVYLETLYRSALRVEELYGKPVDIEAALDRAGKWWLCQARPITTL